MSRFATFTDPHDKKYILNVEHIVAILPDAQIIGVCAVLVGGMQLPAKGTISELEKLITPPSPEYDRFINDPTKIVQSPDSFVRESR
jgi:hypothetical protein